MKRSILFFLFVISTGINAATDYKNLLGDRRWKKLEQQAQLDKKAFYHALMENQKEFQHHSPLSKKRLEKLKGKEVYEYLKNYNGFPHWFPEFDESEPAMPLLLKT